MVTHGIREALVTAGNFPELLTADEVSVLLGVSAATLNRWAALRETTGEQIGPPCYTLSERVRRWDCAEVRSWLKQVRRSWPATPHAASESAPMRLGSPATRSVT